MPTMTREPWARLMIFMTPMMRVMPMAIRAYMPPSNRPQITVCPNKAMTLFYPRAGSRGVVLPPTQPRSFHLGTGNTYLAEATFSGQTTSSFPFSHCTTYVVGRDWLVKPSQSSNLMGPMMGSGWSPSGPYGCFPA